MLWRAWTLACGLPIGALAALALLPEPTSLQLRIAALAGGTLLLVAASLLARLRADDPQRGWHLASGASLGLAALPALAAVWLGLDPRAPWLLPLLAIVCAVGLARGARVRGPAAGPAGRLVGALAVVAASTLGIAGIGGLAAALSPAIPPVDDQRSGAVYGIDASVATRPLPRCRPRPTRFEVLLERGAHPRMDLAGAFLWFDAPAADGRRQVHRLERATGRVQCWTCDHPGNNMRPAPDGLGNSIVFDSDRYASRREPLNTELYVAAARGEAPRRGARRLTFAPGRDDHALLLSGGVVVWSRGHEGSHDVVSASIVSGHGGVLLGTPARLARGGASWTVPLAWSPDARSLVVARGQPYRPLQVVLLDPATDEVRELEGATAPGSSASFSADGGWMLLASTGSNGLEALLPEQLGFLLARIDRLFPEGEPRFRATAVQMGEPRAEPMPLGLGEIARWGEPTGIASLPDGTGFVLGQRRQAQDGVEERLVEVGLDCD